MDLAGLWKSAANPHLARQVDRRSRWLLLDTLAATTFLAPQFAAPRVERLKVDAGSAIACAYNYGAFRDVVVFSTGTSEVQVAGIRMQGEFFWMRTEGQVIRKVVAIRGRLRGTNFLEDAVCAPFAAS